MSPALPPLRVIAAPDAPAIRRRRPVALALAALLALAACDTAEERAEAHYQRGLALIAEGDVERARVEFRNVFRLNGGHLEARRDYARLLREEGDTRGAIAQYLRLVDQDRGNAEGHRALAELALEVQDFETAETHAARAFALIPEDPSVRAVKATLDFRRGDREAAVAMAEAVIAEDPARVPAQMVVIAERMAAGDPAGALARVDAALAAVPGEEALHLARLAALEAAGDMAGAGAELTRMATLFPDNAGVTRALIQWHLRMGDMAGAEAALRTAATRDPAEPAGHLAVVQFLYEVEGAAAARAELERLIAERSPDGDAAATAAALPFRRALAGLDFAEGDTAAAIAALGALRETGTATGADADDIRDIEVELAAMLRATGEAEAAAALVTGVLEADPRHVGALKLAARDHVDADRPEAAIRTLRTALGEAPRDPEIMTIMAMAHEREGNRTLMGERLALAVETSGYGPEESLRYARFLAGTGRTGPAEGVLVDALRRAPEHVDLLAALGALHLERGDGARAGEVAAILRRSEDPAAAAAAAGLEMARLEGEGRLDETIALLEAEAAGAGAGDLRARVALVRARVAAGDRAGAEAEVEALLAEDPESLAGRMLRAGLHVLAGEAAEAEALYRALAAEAPERPEPHRALFALLAGLGRGEEAAAALDAGIAATGGDGAGDPGLRLARAGLLEAAGDVEGAIAVYEGLYAEESGNLVVANNLASLIATHREDAASLERAFAIARRLQGTEVPQFQDTYGWILARRGDAAGALAYLEPAAAALGDDPLVQVHLARAYDALGRREEAREAFARAVAVAGEGSPLPQIAAARARLAELEAAPPPAAPAEAEAAASGG